MKKCDCYFQHGLKPVCYGTKEMETCSCGGDERKCNFYPEKRESKMATEKLAELQKQYGMPTVMEAINAYYILRQLADMAAKVEYMHNFQRERSDIVDYVRKTHPIMLVLKGDLNGKAD